MDRKHKPLPQLARMAGEDNPLTVLGATVPKGAPMRALIRLRDERGQMIRIIRLLVDRNRPASVQDDARALLRELGVGE